MLCNLCMKDVDYTIQVKQHMREHPMTYIMTREICLDCFIEIGGLWEKLGKPKKIKEEKDDAS